MVEKTKKIIFHCVDGSKNSFKIKDNKTTKEGIKQLIDKGDEIIWFGLENDNITAYFLKKNIISIEIC